MLHTQAPPRWSRVAGYVLMGIGGAVTFTVPVTSIRESTGWVVYLWAVFLLLGGTLCSYGAVTDRWIGELLGLPLIAAAFGVYGVVLAFTRTLTGAAAALAFTAVAFILFARWRDVGVIREEATRAAEHRNGAA